MSSVNFDFNSIGLPHQQTAQTKKNDSVNLQNSSNTRRDTYAKWAVISAIAAAGIAGAAILIYQYASSLADRDIKIFFRDDCQYKGDFHNNLRDGRGVYNCPDGYEYDGAWRNDLPHGEGFMKYPNGSRYSGERENGLKHGFGSMTYADGSSYYGDWANGLPHGLGFMADPKGNKKIDANGKVILDCWRNGMISAVDCGSLSEDWEGLDWEGLIVRDEACCPL